MSAYFDRQAEVFRRSSRDAVPYADYLATGNNRERAAWTRAESALPTLPADASTRADAAGRIANVLCLSGIWCRDCVRSVPIVARLVKAAGPSVNLRLVDRDAIPEPREEPRVLGALRFPMVVSESREPAPVRNPRPGGGGGGSRPCSRRSWRPRPPPPVMPVPAPFGQPRAGPPETRRRP